MDKERLPCRDELFGEPVDSTDQTTSRDAGTHEAFPPLAAREGSQTAAGRPDELENALVVGLGEVRLALASDGRLQRDDGEVDLVTVEKGELPVEIVLAQVCLEGACLELEERATEARQVAAGP